MSDAEKGQRLAKRLAHAGLCSRRIAEDWITAGRVNVNGEIILTPAYNVTDADVIKVDNEILGAPDRTRLWLYHKPAGIMVTRYDPQGRMTFYDQLPETMPAHVVPIGRLDLNSEGLLLLTNNGDLAQHLMLPATGWIRRYRVRLSGSPSERTIDHLAKGVTIEGVHYRGAEVTIDKEGRNSWVTIAIKEGKNREVRKLFEHFGHPVSRLIRTAYGPFQLGKLEPGKVKSVAVSVLKEQLGQAYADYCR